MKDTTGLAYPPRLMDRGTAAKYLSIGITMFDELVADGTIPRPKKLRSKFLWDRVDLEGVANGLLEDTRTVKDQMFDHYRSKN